MPFLPRAGRWIAPSIVAAGAGAVSAGLFDGLVAGDDALEPMTVAATTGFVCLLALPVFFALSLVLRGIYAGWKPAELVEEMLEDPPSGAAPRLAGWIAVAWLAFAAFAWTGFQATWLLNSWTSFKPVPVAFGMPLFVCATGLAALLLSRPIARLFAALARKIDRRWRRDKPERRSLVTVPKILVGTAIVTIGLGVALWFFARLRLGPIDISLIYGPLVGIAVTIGVHYAWRRLDRARWIAAALVFTLLGSAIASAIIVTRRQPSLALGIWGDRPIAGLALDRLFDLDRIRANVSLAQFRPDVQPNTAHPDIVLITIDTVRADHTPPYQGKAEMPGLRALAERGLVFEWAFSPGNVTRRSIPSMAIGLQANRVRGRVVGWALRVDPRHVMLAERMRAGGYDTAGFMCCDGFYGPDARTGLQRGLGHLEIEKNGLLLARRAHVWLDERDRQLGTQKKPLFMWMHILEPHGWTQTSGEPHSAEEQQKFYDKSLLAADQVLVEVLTAFSKRRPEEAPIVIVTADHGEGLGDHGQPYHSTDLYNSQIRVPLVVAGPGIAPGRVTETVSLVDLVPTIMDLGGFVPPKDPSIDGRSLEQLITGKREQNLDGGIAFSAMIADRSNPGGLAAVVKGKYKLISKDGTFYELYDIRADPDEQFNIHLRMPQVLVELKRLLNDRVRAGRTSPFTN